MLQNSIRADRPAAYPEMLSRLQRPDKANISECSFALFVLAPAIALSADYGPSDGPFGAEVLCLHGRLGISLRC